MAFKIAEYLTDGAKEAACNRTYEPMGWGAYPHRLPRSGDRRYCPLGVALEHMYPHRNISPAPSPEQVRQLLRRDGVVDAASDFMNAWDLGTITDLAAALGVGGGA